MKLLKPNYKVLTPIDANYIMKSIEYAGRKCYKSEDKISEDTSSAEELISKLIKSGHHSVLEHQGMSVEFVCDRGVSHEMVRHRIASFSQESTRYCNYSKDKFDNQVSFIIPEWCTTTEPGIYNVLFLGNTVANEFALPSLDETSMEWFYAMARAERAYNNLIASKWSPQQARSVLPNSLKTEIVVTANMREWRTIFTQRCASGAHPQMKELMIPLLREMKLTLPALFSDIHPEIV